MSGPSGTNSIDSSRLLGNFAYLAGIELACQAGAGGWAEGRRVQPVKFEHGIMCRFVLQWPWNQQPRSNRAFHRYIPRTSPDLVCILPMRAAPSPKAGGHRVTMARWGARSLASHSSERVGGRKQVCRSFGRASTELTLVVELTARVAWI